MSRSAERVEEDQQVADMMTDKATVEMESPVSGMVVELAGEVGDQVSIGAALVVIETDAAAEGAGDSVPTDDTAQPAAELKAAPPSDEQAEVAEQYEAENPGVEEAAPPVMTTPAQEGGTASSASAEAGAQRSERGADTGLLPAQEHATTKAVLASPAVRARAKDLGVDLAGVKAEATGSAMPISTRSCATARARAITPRTPTARETTCRSR